MKRPYRLGILGVGQVYRRLYAPALALHPEFTVVATADPNLPATSSSVEALLAAVELDGVIVLTPAALHASHVGLALARGLRVLVEKPPALAVAEADGWPRPELVTPAFSRRYWKPYRRPLSSGRTFQFVLETDPASWGARAVDPVERDLLPHAADLATWLSGEEIAAVEDVALTAIGLSGAFVLSQGGRFEWRVAHAGAYRESLTCDGREIPIPVLGPVAEAFRRLRRRPTAPVGAVAALLADWAGSFAGHAAQTLPGFADARSCAAVIERVEGVLSARPK